MADVKYDDASRIYPGSPPVRAVDSLNLDIPDGEFLVLVGPSGSGKSTALRMLAGLEDINEGRIIIGGRDVTNVPPKNRDIAMVFQSYALYPHMSVRENMAFPLRLAKVDDRIVRSKVEEAAQILDLTGHLDRKPANLSGGQRQRVAMGRAIVRNPKAFLMDEPLSNLDAKLRGQMRTSVSKIQKQLGTTTLYVTHDQTEAMTLGDRVVVLRAGYVQQIGSPQFLYDNPANLFVAGFIGSPSMNFVPATLENGTARSALGDIPLTDRVRQLAEAADAPREVIVGIRPEHFEDAALVDASARQGATFTAHVDVLESMGSEKFAHFSVGGEAASSSDLADLAADSGSSDVPGAESQIVARLSAASSAAENQNVELWFDADKIKLFDGASGKNLTYTE